MKGGDRVLVCKICGNPLCSVMRFTPKIKERFYRCKKCKFETKHQKISDNELVFGEVYSVVKDKAQKNK